MAVTFPVDLGGNGQTYDNNSFALGGHRVNFIPVLEQVVVMAETTTDNAINAQDAATAALGSQTASGISEANSLLFRNQAETFAGNASNFSLDAQNSATQAANSLAGTLNAAGLSGAKAYSSFALASADFANLVNNQAVFVVTDETRGNQGAYYRATGTPVSSLTFLRLHEFYTSPVSYVASDSVQNILTMLLVKVGVIPNDAPSLFADLGSDSYFA